MSGKKRVLPTALRHRTTSRRRRRDIVIAVTLTLVAVLVVGLVLIDRRHHGTGSATADTAEAERQQHNAAVLSDSFLKLKTDVPVGVAIVPVGGGTPILLGDQSVPLAWSISKVPLSLITQRNGGADGAEEIGITESDESAAWTMTLAMGSAENAISTITSTLREGGDEHTVVEPSPEGAPWPFFGETPWSTADSAIWTAHLPCMRDSAPVIDRMTRVNGDQDWGLRSIQPNAPVKGGWGPDNPDDESEGYTVRQIGLVALPDGSRASVSMSSHQTYETYSSGISTMNQVAHWIGEHLAQLPGGRCTSTDE
ncbi:MAG: hypothetical protein QM774_06130 [Gordonia sp. (in: high G+C Gram-positive bacteria)]|uniref:hypothetical protein n=1 Tax=Gordonia sp. (in: high G+C Gram-positive bacteria) TaxID=84139 RepID=UPI0039E608AC